MDLLFRRYASPFSFINICLQNCKFLDFVTQIINVDNDDKMWDYYLHKVNPEKSFNEFCENIYEENKLQYTQENINFEATLNFSKKMLNDFSPKGKGRVNGII